MWTSRSPTSWPPYKVQKWLSANNLTELIHPFRQINIDGNILLSLTDQDLKTVLKLDKSEVLRLNKELEKLRKKADDIAFEEAIEYQLEEIKAYKKSISISKERTETAEFATAQLLESEVRDYYSTFKDYLLANELLEKEDKKGYKVNTTSDQEDDEEEDDEATTTTSDPEEDDEEEELPRKKEKEEKPDYTELTTQYQKYTSTTTSITSSSDSNLQIKKTKKLLQSLQRATCHICMVNKKVKVFALPCGHNYCITCFKRYFKRALQDITLMPLKCCQIEIDTSVFQYIAKPADYQKFELMNLESTAQYKVYCPYKDCLKFFSLDQLGSMATELNSFLCGYCNKPICNRCKQGHDPALKCPLKTGEDKTTEDSFRRSDLKQCPRCSTWIELTFGCFHMQCACKHEFCYQCGTTWKNCSCEYWEEERLIATELQRYSTI